MPDDVLVVPVDTECFECGQPVVAGTLARRRSDDSEAEGEWWEHLTHPLVKCRDSACRWQAYYVPVDHCCEACGGEITVMHEEDGE